MNNVLLIFGATFCSVFALGLQSRLINHNNYIAAMLNSAFIGCANLVLYKKLPNVETFWEGAAYALGGAVSIPLAMLFHKKFFQRELTNKTKN